MLMHANAHHSCSSASIYTDAQYVVNISEQIRTSVLSIRTDKIQNWDIISELRDLWFRKPISVFKVKSHREVSSAVDIHDLWTILGNNLADMAATASLQHVPNEIKQLYLKAHQHRETEKGFLHTVLTYIVALNRERSTIVQKFETSTLQSRRDNVADTQDGDIPTPIALCSNTLF